jgi:hypothetical protein
MLAANGRVSVINPSGIARFVATSQDIPTPANMFGY